MRQIKIIVHKNGEIEVDLAGYVGTECLDRLKHILTLGDMDSKVDKPEMFVESRNELEEQNGQFG